MWFVGCKETVVIKNAPKNLEVSNIESSDYSIGVKETVECVNLPLSKL